MTFNRCELPEERSRHVRVPQWDPGDMGSWSWPFGFPNGRQNSRIPRHQDHTQCGRGKFQKEGRLLLDEECGSAASETGHMCTNQPLYTQANRTYVLCEGVGLLVPFMRPQAHCKPGACRHWEALGYNTDCPPEAEVSKGTNKGSSDKAR